MGGAARCKGWRGGGGRDCTRQDLLGIAALAAGRAGKDDSTSALHGLGKGRGLSNVHTCEPKASYPS